MIFEDGVGSGCCYVVCVLDRASVLGDSEIDDAGCTTMVIVSWIQYENV